MSEQVSEGLAATNEARISYIAKRANERADELMTMRAEKLTTMRADEQMTMRAEKLMKMRADERMTN